MAEATAHGRFTWYDLMTTDVDGAKGFYTKVFGWGIEMWQAGGADTPPYAMWTAGGASFGGVMELPPDAKAGGAPPHWLAYIGTDDMESTLARLTGLGGHVMHGPQAIPEAGSFTIFADPQGSVAAVYAPSPGHAQAAADLPAVGQVSWHELATSDYEAAFDFYADLFGWTVQDDNDMGNGWIYRTFGMPGKPPLGGMFNKPPEMPVTAWLCYVRVSDLDAAMERVIANGGKVVNGPQEVPGGDRVAQCTDPQGAMFAMHWPAAT